MAKTNKNKKNQIRQTGNRFLKDDIHKKELAQEHKEYLGMGVPDDFFSKSKDHIFNSLPNENVQKRTVFGLRTSVAYSIAASIVILIGIAIWLQNDRTDLRPIITNTEMVLSHENGSDHFLLNSLFIEDDGLDAYMDDFIVNEILVEAELSEQQLENIFINSLLIEDSLIDSYIDENLIENIVL